MDEGPFSPCRGKNFFAATSKPITSEWKLQTNTDVFVSFVWLFNNLRTRQKEDEGGKESVSQRIWVTACLWTKLPEYLLIIRGSAAHNNTTGVESLKNRSVESVSVPFSFVFLFPDWIQSPECCCKLNPLRGTGQIRALLCFLDNYVQTYDNILGQKIIKNKFNVICSNMIQ